MQNVTQTHLKQLKKPPITEDAVRPHRSFPKWSEPELTFKRMLLRLVFAAFFFLLIDQGISATFHSQYDRLFENDYRFKSGTDITPIGLYAEHIKSNNKRIKTGVSQIDASSTGIDLAAKKVTIAFLGSSPTYGHRIKKTSNTYPYAFEKELSRIAAKNIGNLRKPNAVGSETGTSKTHAGKDGARAAIYPPNIKVYNLASNGQLVSDQYFIAKSLINDVDAFVIQLNYHTFNKSDEKRPAIRYPDLPKRLGVDVTKSEASLLNTGSSTPLMPEKINSSLSRLLASTSFTYANRDFITGQLFGGPPEQLLERFTESSKSGMSSKNPASNGKELFGETNKPFSELTPVQQMLIIKNVSDLYDFKIDKTDREMEFLHRLVDMLAEHKKKAVFFITPLNIEALDEFGIFNWDAYDSNSHTLQAIVESKKLRFMDANAGADILTADNFFDVSHTLDKGGSEFGRQLAERTSSYLLDESTAPNAGAPMNRKSEAK